MTKSKDLLSGLTIDHNVPGALNILEEAFQRHAKDPEYLQGMRMAVPGAGELYGVRVPILRQMAKAVARTYRKAPKTLQAIAEAVWQRGSREHQLVAVFILAAVKLSPAERWKLGVQFLPDVSNWETCDQLCHALLGQALAEDPQYMDVLETWLTDGNFWVRRAALVSTVLLRRAKYDPELARSLDQRALAMCASLLEDQEKYIRKAVDWAIREVIKRHYALGRDWLLGQARQKPSRTAQTTLKLASKKLTQQDRQLFLKALEKEA
jgi:3-methyladenine DNA glycosylase AlkD